MIEVYAHRGGRAHFPENTLDAFEHALSLGVDFIDADIVVSKDDELIVYHDTQLNRHTTRENGSFISKDIPIASLTTDELKRYDVGKINPLSTYATFFPNQQVCDAKIPTLVEVIDLLGSQARLQIELKCPTLNENLFPLIENIAERIEIQSFHWDLLDKIHQLNPNLKLAYLSLDQPNIDLAEIAGRGGKIWGPFQMEVTEAAVQKAQVLGLKVVPWGYPEKEGTAFNEACIQNLIKWGVDGIITDDPKQLKQLLLHNPL